MSPCRRKLLIATAIFAGVVAASAIIHFVTRPKEPSYQGKTLSEWAANAARTGRGIQNGDLEAVRHMGTNALPHLLAWMATADRSYRRATLVYNLWQKLPVVVVNWPLTKKLYQTASGDNYRVLYAVEAFRVLGIDAAPAVPELIRRLENANAPIQLPYVIMALRETRPVNSETVVPGLARFLERHAGHAPFVAVLAMESLGQYNKAARPAAPVVFTFLNHPVPSVRSCATNVLRTIAPETLTNANPKTPPAQQ
jgi:hypothetical protein